MLEIPKRVKALLATANGRRRTRILTEEELLGFIVENSSIPDGTCVTLHAGHVANSYGYKATATSAIVAKLDGVVFVGVNEAWATKGSMGWGKVCKRNVLTTYRNGLIQAGLIPIDPDFLHHYDSLAVAESHKDV